MWAWGDNGNGQLGDGTTTPRLEPVQVTTLTGDGSERGKITPRRQKRRHSLGLGLRRQRSARRRNQNEDEPRPGERPRGGERRRRCGVSAHSSRRSLKSDGSVWGWGYNGYGQLGDGTQTSRLTPVAASGLAASAGIAAGAYHSLAVRTDGTARAWGETTTASWATGRRPGPDAGGSSRLCEPHPRRRRALDSLALQDDGTVWAWGYNGYGQLGDGSDDGSIESRIDYAAINGFCGFSSHEAARFAVPAWRFTGIPD